MKKQLLPTLFTLFTTIFASAMNNYKTYVVLCPKLETTREKAITTARKTSNKLPNSIHKKLYTCTTYQTDNLPDPNVHSKKYLNNLTEHSSIMHAAIFNKVAMGLMPNWYSERSFKSIKHNMIYEVNAKVATTKVTLKHNLLCTICLFGGYSYAGHNQGSKGHIYADIPAAAACAIKDFNCDNILVIDQLRNSDLEDYNEHGNGTIFNTLPLFKHDNGTSKILFDTYKNTPPNLAFLTIAFDNATSYLPTIEQLYTETIPMIITLFGHKTNDDDTLIQNIITIENALAAIRKIRNITPQPEKQTHNNEIKTAPSLSRSDYYNDTTTSISPSSSNDTDTTSSSATSSDIEYAQPPSCNHSPNCKHAQYILKETARIQWINAIDRNNKNNDYASSNTDDSDDSEETMNGFALFAYLES